MEENEEENILPASGEVDEEKAARRAIATKRVFWLFIILSLIMVAMIVWEVIDIAL